MAAGLKLPSCARRQEGCLEAAVTYLLRKVRRRLQRSEEQERQAARRRGKAPEATYDTAGEEEAELPP